MPFAGFVSVIQLFQTKTPKDDRLILKDSLILAFVGTNQNSGPVLDRFPASFEASGFTNPLPKASVLVKLISPVPAMFTPSP